MSHNARRLRPDNPAARRQDDAGPLEPISRDGDIEDYDEDTFDWQNEPFQWPELVVFTVADAARFSVRVKP